MRVEFPNSGDHVGPDLLALQCAVGQIGGQIQPQRILILPVGDKTLWIIFVMRISKGVRQIVGQFSQCVILPHGPAAPPLEAGDAGLDIGQGVGIIVPSEFGRPQGAF